jgi:hypothetical protein
MAHGAMAPGADARTGDVAPERLTAARLGDELMALVARAREAGLNRTGSHS